MADPILIRQYVPLEAYKPRAYLNGFPKAGLHWLEQLVQPLLSTSEVGTGGTQWLGTYKWHSWTTIWQDMRQYVWRLSCMERGTYLMGHSGYHEDARQMMRYGNVAHIFLYRDLRDVAVSQTHHIMDEGRLNWQHQHKDLYRMLGGFDEALAAVIEGMGPYPGLVARWNEYAPWLECEEVLCLRYEDLKADAKRCAGQIILFLLKKATELLEGPIYQVEMAPEDIRQLAEQMVENGSRTHQSTTFRTGETGGWRSAFTAEHVQLWKLYDAEKWLVRLGYEESDDWGLTGEAQAR